MAAYHFIHIDKLEQPQSRPRNRSIIVTFCWFSSRYKVPNRRRHVQPLQVQGPSPFGGFGLFLKLRTLVKINATDEEEEVITSWLHNALPGETWLTHLSPPPNYYYQSVNYVGKLKSSRGSSLREKVFNYQLWHDKSVVTQRCSNSWSHQRVQSGTNFGRGWKLLNHLGEVVFCDIGTAGNGDW